jgi:hypothetical protein
VYTHANLKFPGWALCCAAIARCSSYAEDALFFLILSHPNCVLCRRLLHICQLYTKARHAQMEATRNAGGDWSEGK